MPGNTAKGDVIELGGREFKRVKNGLDEAKVASFIDELISERDGLIQSQDHLSSLTKLAERTIAEADKMAEQIKKEAIDQAKAESAAIMTEAEEQAQQMAEEKRAEVITIANEQAAGIKAEAEQKAALLLEDERRRIQRELGHFVNQLFGQLLSELESLKQQAVASQAEFEHKLSQTEEESSAVTVEPEEENSAVTVKSEEESGAATTEENKGPDEFPEPIHPVDQTERHDGLSELFQTGDQANMGDPDWEVEVLPPVDIMKIIGVVNYLDQLPEVESTEIIPRPDMPSIMVFLREPMNLIDVLRTLPEVSHVEEDTTDTAVAEGKPKKVQISLSGETVSQEKK